MDTLVQGEPLLAHAVRGVLDAGCVTDLRVVVPARNLGSYELIVQTVPGTGKRCRVLSCDGNRAESIRSAFENLSGEFDVILICDAARPFVPPSTLRAVAETVSPEIPAVVPVLPVTDTVKLVDGRDVIIATEDRAGLRAVQAPFGCTPAVLHEMCARAVDPLTDPPDTVRTIAGHQNAIRVTTPFDVAVVTALLSEEQA
ncbi:2-C-methyl-D-erythritol 4-phosphate cytidylyltransferase [Amycolatopsis acidiphila]|uniref:IspD/TarI family cytidylyltransferase n=1 Tax=Amycolatopsis acidiphila TaxID=715473 RepID=UPI001F3A75B5|nr:2-C-methyl-D-erythritol 4-phosphate cytidylyltransferase [Amycolatopsis acidiphila]UIJ59409.1 2-C-methyl-D-erythritol 4-phosphate cytidylyltransferase [Amycolatopsis acidiphila]